MFPIRQHTPSNTRPPAAAIGAQSPVYGNDRISLIGFHDQGFVIRSRAKLHDGRLQSAILDLHRRVGGSSTNLTDGLRHAVEVLRKTPSGILRRVWLLTDGYPNRQQEHLWRRVAEAREARINVNCIGFGDRFDAALLQRISQATHRGHFVSVQSLRALTDALATGPARGGPHRAEHTVYAIDLSGSMVLEQMQGRAKIAVVQDALIQLLHHKMKCFA